MPHVDCRIDQKRTIRPFWKELKVEWANTKRIAIGKQSCLFIKRRGSVDPFARQSLTEANGKTDSPMSGTTCACWQTNVFPSTAEACPSGCSGTLAVTASFSSWSPMSDLSSGLSVRYLWHGLRSATFLEREYLLKNCPGRSLAESSDCIEKSEDNACFQVRSKILFWCCETLLEMPMSKQDSYPSFNRDSDGSTRLKSAFAAGRRIARVFLIKSVRRNVKRWMTGSVRTFTTNQSLKRKP